MITAYYRFESLPQTVRDAHKINSLSRVDCVASWNPNEYAGLSVYQNPKGMLFFYFVESRDMVKASDKRRASYTMSNGKLNLTSLHYERPELKQFCFGYPNAKQNLNDGSPNPALPYRHDAYLFVCDWQKQAIELLLVENGKPFIDALYYDLIDGNYDEELKRIRTTARPYFLYEGL